MLNIIAIKDQAEIRKNSLTWLTFNIYWRVNDYTAIGDIKVSHQQRNNGFAFGVSYINDVNVSVVPVKFVST